MLAVGVVLAASPAFTQPAGEYQVKAAFILNFARFTEWPNWDRDSRTTFVLGVIGEDPFGEILEQVVESETIAGRSIEIRRLENVGDGAAECHVLFVGSVTPRQRASVLAAVADTSVLTVGETMEFAEHGGVIALVEEDLRIRFVINVEAARRSDLRLSSKLLSLARVIGETPSGPSTASR